MRAMASVPNLQSETDESLMLDYAAGNLQAFNLLYDRHEMGVWRYVLRTVRVQAIADDLLQETWLHNSTDVQQTKTTAHCFPSSRSRHFQQRCRQ